MDASADAPRRPAPAPVSETPAEGLSDEKKEAQAAAPRKSLLDRATTLGIAELLLLGLDRPSRGIGRLFGEGPPEDFTGRLIGDYRIEKELGRGGMGAVFRATNMRVGSTVALKLLRFAPGESVERLRRFELEARAAAELNHPNIINVFDVGQVGDLYYLAMEYIEGRPLSEKIAQGPLDPQQLVRIGVDVCNALEFAHAAGVIHRDIKPSNILIEPCGRAQLMDFGLARDADPASRKLTEAGSIMGTAHYMSPEQAQGRSHLADSRSDIHSLGVVLYEMSTGVPPFDGATTLEIFQKVAYEEPLRPCKLRPGLDHDLELIVLKTLEKDPDRRYRSAHALKEDLLAFGSGEPIKARAPSLWYRGKKFLKRHLHRVIPASIALAASGLMLAFVLLHERSILNQFEARELDYRRQIEDLRLEDLLNPGLERWRLIHALRLADRDPRKALAELALFPPSNDPAELARRALWTGALRLELRETEAARGALLEARHRAEVAGHPELALSAVAYLQNDAPLPPAPAEGLSEPDRTCLEYHLGHAALLRGDRKQALLHLRLAKTAAQPCLERNCAAVELAKLEAAGE